MNNLHIKIMELISEIDSICKKYDITYYAAGGTAIGAVRHNGFIPWDDDIDIYMTRSEFYKFREAFKKENLEGRTLECIDDNEEYPGTIPRYINTETTDLCRFHCLNTCAGGIIIDIFILDPIPSDPELQDEYRAKLNIYAEFTMPYYAFSYRNDSKYLDLYFKYKELEKEIGKQDMLKLLENEIFTYPEEKCEFYMLRWATLPSIFPKDMFETPAYFPFETMEMPLPTKWYQYLKQLYGFDWMYVPQNVDNQIQHVAVINTEISYDKYTVELDQFINKKAALKVYNKRKISLLRREILDRPMQEQFLKMKADILASSIERICSEKYNSNLLKDVCRNEQYVQFLELIDFYLLTQLSPVYSGKMKHGNWYRYKNPIFIPISDEILATAIHCLLAVNEVKKAERLLEIRDKSGKEKSSYVEEMRNLLVRINKLWAAFYCHSYTEVENILNTFSPYEHKLLPVVEIEYLYKVQMDDTDNFENQLKALLETYNHNGALLKAYGDLKSKQGETNRAKELYKKALRYTNNGIIELDIRRLIGEDDLGVDKDICYVYKMGTAHRKQIYLEQKKLLVELNDLCEKNGIEYSLAGDTALYAYYEQKLPPNHYINSVIMTPENAKKFISVVNNEHKENRQLDYMLNNDRHIGDDIYYGSLDSAYINLNTLYNMKCFGYFIRIIIARAKAVNITNKISTDILERVCVTNCNADIIHKSKFRRAIKSGSRLLTKCLGEKRLSNLVFSSIVCDSNKSKEYYVYKRKRLKDRVLETYPRELFDHFQDVYIDEDKFHLVQNQEVYFCDKQESIDETYSGDLVNSLWSYVNPNTKTAEVRKIFDFNTLNESEEWYNHLQAQSYSKKVKKANASISRYWKILLRADDRVKLYLHYMSLKPEILKAYETHNNDELKVLFSDLNDKVKEYADMRMGFYFLDEVFDIFYKWLEDNDQKEEVEYYKSLVPEFYFQKMNL